MATPGLKVEGMEELLWALKEMKGVAQAEVLADAGDFAMEPMRALASSKAPRRTGALSRGIQKEVTEKRDGFARVELGPHEDDFYGLFIEMGWRPGGRSSKSSGARQSTGTVAPRPFLRPAFDGAKDTVVSWFRNHLIHWFDSHVR